MKYKILLILIITISSFLRIYKLGEIPNSYTPDEMAQGYTAYSVLKTGKDEWGSPNLFLFRSFGDYKPALQTLLIIPSIKFFGLTPFAVRFPNAILAILTTVVIYFLALNIFNNKKIALISSLFFALSPWSISLSRIALEANILVFIISLAFLFFTYFTNSKKQIFLLMASVFFGLSLFTYHSAKVFTPLFLIGIILFFYKKINKFSIVLLISVFSLFFIANTLIDQQIKSARTNDIAIFNPTDNWQGLSDNQYEITKNGLPYLLTKSFFNKLTYTFDLFLKNYLSYFSPQFLITHGAGETTYGMLPDNGAIGLIPLIGLIVAIYVLIVKKSDSNNYIFLLFFGLLISPIAASLAKGNYSGNRASIMIPFFCLISAYGINQLNRLILNRNSNKIIFLFVLLLFILNSSAFLLKYFFQANQILAKGMLFGNKEAMEYINKIGADKQIVYSRKLSEPQSYVAFFNRIEPKVIQSESKKWLKYEQKKLSFLDQLGEYQLKNYTFKEINFYSDSQLHNAILVGRPEEFNNSKPDKIIYYPSSVKQEPAIYIYLTKQ